MSYYNQEELYKDKEKRTVYQEIYNNNCDYSKDLAIEFFGAKINYEKLFKKIDQTAKPFKNMALKRATL